MAEECRALGLTYLGMADHSQTSVYAGGLTPDDIARQSDEIDKLNESMQNFTIFKGIEADILPDGSLDYDDDVLAKLDFVVVSVHSGFSMGEKEMTDRIERAIRNQHTTMLGHMTGRLLLAREGYRLDIPRIIKACAEEGVVIELNANPRRLDIDWRFIPEALAQGVKISINPDAHRPTGLSHIDYGLMIARKGGATAGDIINCLDAEDVAVAISKRK
jgi:DNA polymerase (family 10)